MVWIQHMTSMGWPADSYVHRKVVRGKDGFINWLDSKPAVCACGMKCPISIGEEILELQDKTAKYDEGNRSQQVSLDRNIKYLLFLCASKMEFFHDSGRRVTTEPRVRSKQSDESLQSRRIGESSRDEIPAAILDWETENAWEWHSSQSPQLARTKMAAETTVRMNLSGTHQKRLFCRLLRWEGLPKSEVHSW